MMNPFSWLQMTNMISYQGLVRTFLSACSSFVSILTRSNSCASLYKSLLSDERLSFN
ncbi:gGDEF domain-containing protein [Aeromonas caviae]|nr:gGDEF domain-containing protein [Aeromonas caviae]